MENASKALIIAASVLVAIMIIALGVRIFNGAQSSADTTALDSAEITMFNQKFERFAGTQSGSNVKSLLSFAISNASTNKDDPIKLPTVAYETRNEDTALGNTDATNDISNYIDKIGELRSRIISNKLYKVTIAYSQNGFIKEVGIGEKVDN